MAFTRVIIRRVGPLFWLLDMIEQEQIDPQQEKRRLRAAAEGMRSKQNYAKGGFMAGGLAAALSFQMREALPLSIRIVLVGVAFALPIVFAIPFLRSQCPKCKNAYHGFMSLFRSAENPNACKSCGFHINKHITRY